MSGFEIAGVVLGAIPLLIEGLKTYQHGLQTVSHMVRYEKAINDLTLTFSAAALRYIDICERLVQPLMLDAKELSDLLDRPRDGAWKSRELGRRVEESLDKNFTTFIGIAGRLNDRLMKFAINLDLDPANDLKPRWLLVPHTGQPTLRERIFSKSSKTLRGLKAGFENGSLEKALQKVEEDLRRLEWLLDGRDRDSPTRNRRTRAGRPTIWKSIRTAASSIYTGLAAHWQCHSTHQHTVSLRLETRKASDDGPNARFGLIFDLKQGTTQTQHDVEIEPKAAMASNQPQHQSANQASFTISSLLATPQVQVTHVLLPPSQPTGEVHIQNLCGWQQSPQSIHQGKLGFLRHDKWQYHLHRGKLACHSSAVLSHVSLHDCLMGSSIVSGIASPLISGLGPKEKIHIALVLASTLLQLGETPWLTQGLWSMEEVFLLDLQQRTQMMANPYIRHEFTSSMASSAISTTPAIENELVFALGVMLIELSHAKPLKHFKQPSDGDHPYTNLQIASRLARDLYLREGEKYAGAATRCIKCHFDVQEQSFDKLDFQEQFYVGVVQPLLELWEAIQ